MRFWHLIGLCIALVCCVAVIAWQAGRLSAMDDSQSLGRKSKARAAVSDTGYSAASEQNIATNRRSGNRWTFDTDSSRSSNPAPSSAGRSSSPAGSTESNGSGAGQTVDSSQSEAIQVRRYFTSLDLASATAPISSDPHAMAGDMLAAAAKGDYSGLDSLADGQQQMIDSIRMIVPPDPCKEHHRLTLSTLEQGRDMIVSMKANIASGDVQKLMLSTTQSQSITKDAEEVDRLGQQLKARYDIP
jgi:hypothetical protein